MSSLLRLLRWGVDVRLMYSFQLILYTLTIPMGRDLASNRSRNSDLGGGGPSEAWRTVCKGLLIASEI